MSCRNCALWADLVKVRPDGRRECHANPPMIMKTEAYGSAIFVESIYPLTSESDWCSQEMTVTQLLQGRHGL